MAQAVQQQQPQQFDFQGKPINPGAIVWIAVLIARAE